MSPTINDGEIHISYVDIYTNDLFLTSSIRVIAFVRVCTYYGKSSSKACSWWYFSSSTVSSAQRSRTDRRGSESSG